jgi:hypothetical protein
VEIDGAAFGDDVRVKNLREKRTDRREKKNLTGRRLWLAA